MNENSEWHNDLDLVDLGDANVETKQGTPTPLFVDSVYQLGSIRG